MTRWAIDNNPFKSDASLNFEHDIFRAHLGGYTYSGRYSVDKGRPNFQGVIVTEGAVHESERRNEKAWAYWRCVGGMLLKSTRFAVKGDRLTMESPNGKLTFQRIGMAH